MVVVAVIGVKVGVGVGEVWRVGGVSAAVVGRRHQRLSSVATSEPRPEEAPHAAAAAAARSLTWRQALAVHFVLPRPMAPTTARGAHVAGAHQLAIPTPTRHRPGRAVRPGGHPNCRR